MQKDKVEINYELLNSMDDWVRIIDTKGKVAFINQALKNSLSKSPKLRDYLGENIDLLLSNDNEIIKTTTMDEEKLIDGRYYSIKSSPIFLDGDFFGTIEVYRDINSESMFKIDLYNANKDMVDDIRFVRKIQANILPKDRTYGKLGLEGIYRPSEKLSGDFYDIIKINSSSYAFYIADVMGHGVKASIMTMFIKVSMNAIFDKHPNYGPSRALMKLREKFAKLSIDTSQYFTAWLGIFNMKTNKLTFSNAGHNCPPLVYKKGYEEAGFLLINGRMISNIIEPDEYIQKDLNLAEGDKLLFFTDGAIEAKNKAGDEYGLERLRQTFTRNQDIAYVYEDIRNFARQELEDDLSLATIEYKDIKEWR